MEDKKNNRPMDMNPKFLLATSVAVGVFIAAAFFAYIVREAHVRQIEMYVAWEVKQKSELLNHHLDASRVKVQLMASELSRRLKSLPVTPAAVKEVAENSEDFFDYVDFLRLDGVLVSEDNQFDLYDEPLYREAISRKNNVFSILKSKRSLQALAGFVQPVTFKDSVVGYLVGSMGGRTKLRHLLDSSLSNRRAYEYILDSKLNVVSSLDEAEYGLPFRSVLTGNFADRNMDLFRKAALDDSIVEFTYGDENGAHVAGVYAIGDYGFYLVVLVPPEEISKVSIQVVVGALLIALIIVLIVFLVIYLMNRASRMIHTENRDHFQSVVGALAESYGSVFEVNLDTGENQCIRIAPILVQKAGALFSGDAKYNQIMAVYANRMVIPEDKALFDQVLTLEKVKEAFANRSQFDFVFRTQGNGTTHYIQALFVRPSKIRPEFVMGFKNFDETMELERSKQKKQLEQRIALEIALEKARSADKAKSKFLFNMSHDIRTPMNAVLGYDTLALQYLWELGLPPEQTEKLSRCLNNIQMSGKQLMGLINSVLNMARIESGEVFLEESPTVVAELTGEVAVTFEETAREKNIMLLVSRNMGHKYIFCDKVKVQQVILNVVSNAVKYTENAGTVRVNFREMPHEKEGWCYMVTTVEDNGVGISESFLPHIFEDFERERSATISGVVGSGLGLSIVKKYVDLMGGSIEVNSKVGEGTKVVVKTPHRIAESDSVGDGKNSPKYIANLQGKRILLVEDNKLNREIAEEMLKSFGVHVECSEDGMECLERLEREPSGSYDLILMDVQMPRMDGYETTRRIRQMSDPLKACIKIYAMTANAFAEDVQESVNAGMDGHISKPVDFTKFYNLLQKVFN